MIAPGFTGGTLDRADPLRHDPAAVAAALADPRARLLVLHAFEPQATDDGRLAWTTIPPGSEPGDFALLGLDADRRPHFVALDAGQGAPPPFRSPTLLTALDALKTGEAAIYAAARSLIGFHARNRYCSACGSRTAPFRAGWGRTCRSCKTEHFPRVDPVVIMIAEHDGRALLGRQPSWPPGRYSALAGFLEPGESIEEAVSREIHEESGVRVTNVRYIASQPWPFPSQLMIACIAQAEGDEITLDINELEDARWFTRDEVSAALAGHGPFAAPPHYAIAHTLLQEWVRGI